MLESLIASNASRDASPCGTIQTCDWQPLTLYSSVRSASASGGSLRPRSIRYW